MRYVGEDVGVLSRLGSVISYLSGGWIGIFILIVLYVMKKRATNFFMFNVYQSIIISFSLFVIGMAWAILYNIFAQIPILQLVVSWINFIFNKPIILARSFTELFIAGLILYCVIFSLFGKRPLIYKISELIRM